MDIPSCLRQTLGYLGGLRVLISAKDNGMLVDPTAIERDLARAESTIGAVLAELQAPAGRVAAPVCSPVLDDDGVPINGRPCVGCE
jgi:hypothetical protein